MQFLAIGCFHFSIGTELKEKITISTYTEEVKKCLESINTVSNVRINYNNIFNNNNYIVPQKETKTIRNAEVCYPYISHYDLSFNLYIPYRLQESLTEKQYVRTETENFRVILRHDWHGPITFIHCLDAKKDCKPSSAVRIIREFLEKEFATINSFLKFDFLGPSPFHADIKMSLEKDAKLEKFQIFNHQRFEKRGYDNVEFKTDLNKFPNEIEALESLMSIIEDEIGFYYHIVLMNRKKSYSWYKINTSLQEILLLKANKKLSLIQKFFTPLNKSNL